MFVRLSLRQKSRLKNVVILLLGGYLFVTWSRQGSEGSFSEDFSRADEVLIEVPIGDGKGFHHIPDYSKPREGPGEKGQGVSLKGEELAKGQKQIKEVFMNVLASDKISFDRSIPDSRSKECRALSYPAVSDLPTVSVVIIYTNEFFSSVMRTVHSVVNRTPVRLLKEVILVDDISDREELKQVDEHIKRFGGLVRLYRSTERLGLIRAKVYGAKKATGDVLVFLDSHCEANEGWVEPLLARIQEERTAVVCPTIDGISSSNMAYLGGAAGGIGSFWWSLHYSMEGMPKREIERRKNPATDYIRTPTMAGGLFAANREYFFEVGAYDEEMDIWGGENLEISFRVWMCGGSVEIVPCSHVGHIYRDGHPYDMTGRNGNKDVHGTNSKRLAEVWMDDYKRLYYMYRMGLKDQPVGDISSRLALRKRLKCQSFKWFLDNVIPQKFIMDEDVHAFGQVYGERGLCLDTLQRLENKGTVNLGVFGCQGGGSSSQMFSISRKREFRREATCVDIGSQISAGVYKVILKFCREDALVVFDHPQGGGYLRHHDRQLCIDADGVDSGGDLSFRKCEEGKASQQWKIGGYFEL